MKKLLKKRPPLTLVLAASLVLLLALFATLQYRWLGQVSRAERERMQESLSAGATQFSRDFDRELARAYLSLQMDAADLRDNRWDDYSKRYDRWFQTAPYPRLVKGVFVVEEDDKSGPRLLEFDRAQAMLKPREWPPELLTLRDSFADMKRAELPEPAMLARNLLNTIAEDVPAIVTPILGLRMITGDRLVEKTDKAFVVLPKYRFIEKERKTFTARVESRESAGLPEIAPLTGHNIITLDLDYIKQEFLPLLARRYFASGDTVDYNVAIVEREDPKKIIYRSDAKISDEEAVAGDQTAGLFGLRFEEFSDLLPEMGMRGETAAAGEHRSQIMTFSIRSESPGETSAKGSLTGNKDGVWQLVIKHRAGSLDLAVAGVRHRNLIVSFGILLLLAVSVAMIIISTRRAQRLARQQIEFVAGVSHELRTPLAVICSAGENLADGVIDDRAQIKRYGALIKGEGQRLAKMVEQVLDFAGAQSGQKTYDLYPTDANDLIDAALADCRMQISEGGFDVEKEIEMNLPPVLADRAALLRAIQNLLNNAMKYAGESRLIRIGAKSVQGRRGLEVEITIEDRGMGITASDLPHIFEPFYRGREAASAQIHGNGLGLSLVKHIIDAHGGSVDVESAPGRGSAFTLRLPAVAQATEASDEALIMMRDA